MTYYIRQGTSYYVTDEAAVDIQKTLPVGNYFIKENPQSGELYLEQVDSFKPISKLYGNLPRYTDRILRTFTERTASTGVMFTGEKGSGKSLLAKEICIEAAKQGIPTVVINSPYCGDKFNNLIQDISQEAIVLFDEFEKVYHDTQKQEAILTLLDGVFPTKKLFVMTCNDKWRIDQHMRNRPGRLFYMIDFRGLDAEFIREYCEDNLNNKVHIDKLVTLASLFAEFNFDMLKAVVEDMNRYNETPQEALEILNAKPEYEKNSGGAGRFEVHLITPCGQVMPKDVVYPEYISSNPLGTKTITIEPCFASESDVETDTAIEAVFGNTASNLRSGNQNRSVEATNILKKYLKEDDELYFEQDDLVKVDGESGTFEYHNQRTGFRLRLVRERKSNFDYFKIL